MKPNHLSAVALLAFLAGGCANIPSVGPDYHKPETKTPAHWSEPLAGGETNSAAVTAAWWKNFHDAELDSLIERAACSNLDLRIAQSRVREARAQYSGAFADLWPTVNGGGSFNRWRESEHQPVLGSLPIPAGVPFDGNVYQAGFDAAWEIDVFGGKRRAVEAAKAQLSAAEFGRRDVLVTLLGEVARNYVDLRGYQRRLAIANQNIEAQENSLAITQNRFTNGLATDLDVQQAKTVLATTRAEVPTLETAQFRQRCIASKFCWDSNPGHCRRNWPKPRRCPRSRRKCRSVCLPNCCCAGPTSAVPNVNSPPRRRTSAWRNPICSRNFILPARRVLKASAPAIGGRVAADSGRLARRCNGGFSTPAASAPTSRSKMPGRNRRWPLTNKPC